MLRTGIVQTIEGRLGDFHHGYALRIKIACVFGMPVFVRCEPYMSDGTSVEEHLMDVIGESNLRFERVRHVDYNVILEGSVKWNDLKAAFKYFPIEQIIVPFAVRVTKFISIEKTRVW